MPQSPAGDGERHRYQDCRDELCGQFPCRVYRDGWRDGHAAGHADGYAAGRAEGYADGYADGAK